MIEFSTIPFRVRYSETDQMGFVHHSNYLKYFEMARIEWLNSIGGKPINLGLDLAGGIHFLLEVDTDRYSAERLSSEGASIIDELQSRNINAN